MSVEGAIEDRRDGQLIKVVATLDEGAAFLGRLQNGSTARFSLGEIVELERGDVVLVGPNWWELMPSDAWLDDTSVGVVRKLLDDGVVIEGSLGIKVLQGEPSVPVIVGNTVEYTELDGILRVIAEAPLRARDAGIDDDLREYVVEPGEDETLTFENFGGYEEVVSRAKELIETQLDRREELEAIGARPVRGVIFTGPPGTGKTHLARIIARLSNAKFFVVSGPSIVSKFVGDSEETLRRLFDAAKNEPRAIIFFDEIDSIAARRSSDSHGESKRVVAQLLTLLDGFEETRNVVAIAATNRVEDIDEALLRPGRFDWEIQFGLPTLSDRRKILAVRAAQLETTGDLPFDEISILTEGWSGAMLTAIWTEAALVAAGDGRRAVAAEDMAVAYERVQARPVRAREGSGDVA